MQHVFVETNWIVDHLAPAHHHDQPATSLLNRANRGELKLLLPAICVAEARYPLSTKFQPRQVKAIRGFLHWARPLDLVTAADDQATRRVLDQFEGTVKRDLATMEASLASLRQEPGLEIFPLDAEMLSYVVDLSFAKLDLKPYDQAILAAVLIRAKALQITGVEEFSFCDLDADLQPWDRYGNAKPELVALYGEHHIQVYDNFLI